MRFYLFVEPLPHSLASQSRLKPSQAKKDKCPFRMWAEGESHRSPGRLFPETRATLAKI